MWNFLRRRTGTEHEQIAALLSAYVDDELAAGERQRVEAHVARCEACAQDLHTLRYAKSLLTDLPAPRLPRSFVVRRADVEAPAAAAPRRTFGLRSRLAYGYLKGATALVTVAFALLVAGDLIAQFSLGVGAPSPSPAREAYATEKAVVVETTLVVRQTEEKASPVVSTPLTEVEKVVEKALESVPTATPALPRGLPTASLPLPEKEQAGVQSLGVPGVAPTATEAADTGPPTETAVAKAPPQATATPTPTPVPPTPTT